MTFSIVGRCAETGQLGIAITRRASPSAPVVLAARRHRRGGYAEHHPAGARPADPRPPRPGPGPWRSADQALSSNGYGQYRQVTVIDQHGRTALFTGREALGVHHARAGEQCVAAGNLLAAPEVIEAMVDAFENAEGLLAERLLAAMGAALAAGGEAGPVHSAALSVVGDLLWPVVDLRVDWAEHDPIGRSSDCGSPTNRRCRTM